MNRHNPSSPKSAGGKVGATLATPPRPGRRSGDLTHRDAAAPAVILIVDDEIQNCKLLETLLQHEGYSTFCATSGEEALAAVALHAPDLILLDIVLPGMAGYQVASTLKADPATSNIPIIMVTQRLDREAHLAGLKSGAEEFLTKPVDRAELWLRVRNLLRLKSFGDFLQNHTTILEQEVQTRTRSLLDSEARFRSLSMLSTDWFWEQDENHRFVRFSGGDGVKGWGPDQKKAVGLHRWDLGGVAPISSSWDEHRALLDAHQPFRKFEYRRILGDGRLQYVEASGEPIFDAAGRFTGYRGVAAEITERKRAEHDLQRFRAAMDSSGDGIVLVDRASMRYIDVNQTLCDLVGYTRQELIGMTPMALFGADRAILERDYDAIIADVHSSASKVEGHYRHRNGTLIPIETRRRALRTEDGWIIVGSARDITERKRGEEALRRLSSAMDATADAIYLVDRSSMRFVYVNDTACRMQNRTREEVLALGPDGVLSVPRAELEATYDAIIAGGQQAKPLEMQRRRAGSSTVWVELRRHALRSGDGWTIVTLVRDITERKASEDRIRRLNRVYAMNSQINALIVRAQNREELFREACHIAISDGGFTVARVVELDQAGTARIEASSETDTRVFQRIVDEYNGNPEKSQSLLAVALRSGRPLVSNDVAVDARIPDRATLTKDGTYALALLPIMVEKRVAGIVSLRAREAGMFDAEELRLLLELVANLSFALELMEKRQAIDYLAYYDVLTGLANRNLFLERMAQYMRSAISGGHRLALFLIDLERFRNINDSLGRPAGDALLRLVAEWLTRDAGNASLVARIGADHFALVLPEVRQDSNTAQLLDGKIQAFLDHPFRLNDAEFRIAIKVGIALFPGDGADATTLLRNAETALKKAKARGERYVYYKQKMSDAVAGKLTLENQLRRALDNDEFVLHYQPKASLASGRLTGTEALIRWNDPQTGLVPPARFIPILEETGLIYEVGRWALRKAVEDYLRWRSAGLPAVRIAVNVSPLQLRNRGFIQEIKQTIAIDPHASAGLELEITESLIMEDVKHSIASLQAIRAMGVVIAIDDFGTGFSSLSHLAKLPIDTLKIDRSFVTDMTAGPDGLALVSTIISLAHSLKLKVVAEGVETEEQKRLLRLLSCDELQGFLFSKPVPGEVFAARFLATPSSA